MIVSVFEIYSVFQERRSSKKEIQKNIYLFCKTKKFHIPRFNPKKFQLKLSKFPCDRELLRYNWFSFCATIDD